MWGFLHIYLLFHVSVGLPVFYSFSTWRTLYCFQSLRVLFIFIKYSLLFSVHIEVRGQHIRVVFPSLPCQFQGPSTGCHLEAWWQSANVGFLLLPGRFQGSNSGHPGLAARAFFFFFKLSCKALVVVMHSGGRLDVSISVCMANSIYLALPLDDTLRVSTIRDIV